MRLLLAIAALCALVGCRAMLPPASGTAPATPAAGGGASAFSPGHASPQAAAASDYGTLRLIIRWPSASASAYRAQLIPDSTAMLGISVMNGATQVASASVLRQPSQATASANVQVKAATNLSITVTAYASGTSAPSGPIAQGTASGVTIGRSQDTLVPITMASLFVPAISSLSENAGAVGDLVTLSGTNLAPSWAATPSVSFNGTGGSPVPAVVTAIAGSGSLTVAVPAGAAVGSVSLTADGVLSPSTTTFWVASALAIDAPKASWDTSPANTRIVNLASTLAFSATPTWVLSAGATDSAYGPAPSPAWTLSNAAAGAISTAGVLTAGTSFATASVSASYGGVVSNAIALDVQNVVSGGFVQ